MIGYESKRSRTDTTRLELTWRGEDERRPEQRWKGMVSNRQGKERHRMDWKGRSIAWPGFELIRHGKATSGSHLSRPETDKKSHALTVADGKRKGKEKRGEDTN